MKTLLAISAVALSLTGCSLASSAAVGCRGAEGGACDGVNQITGSSSGGNQGTTEAPEE